MGARKPKEASKKQKITIAKIQNALENFKNSRDIKSPTHYSDLREELKKINLSEDERELITMGFIKIIAHIKEID